MFNEDPSIPTTNRNALISLAAAVLTIISFCTAVAPVPLTGFVCYPTAALFGVVTLITGLNALRHLRSNGKNEHLFAMIGVGVGALATMATLCATTLGILLAPQIIRFIHQVSI